jgi:hypothetical protein
MLNNKLTISIISFVGSVLLFIGATFAWLLLSNIVEIESGTRTVINVDASAGILVSLDGIVFDTTSVVVTESRVPGDVVFYQLFIENTGNVELNIRVRFFGFINSPADAQKDTTNYDQGRSLIEVVYLNASNNIDSSTIENILLVDAIGTLPSGTTFQTAHLILFNNINIPIGENATVTFSFTFSPNAGNEYQNLKLSIDSIIVDAISE